jgi:hypothetical protein
MRRNRSEGESGPLTLGQAAKVGVRIMVWCKACQHRDEPDMAAQVAHCGEGMTVIDWRGCCAARHAAPGMRISS